MNTPLVRPGSVGMPTYDEDDPEPVDDPSPGVNSVLYDGTIGPTPPEDERREHWGLPPLPLMAQVTSAAQPATAAAPRAPAAATATPAAPASPPPATRRP